MRFGRERLYERSDAESGQYHFDELTLCNQVRSHLGLNGVRGKMAAGTPKQRSVALWVFRIVLGVLFLTIGIGKLTGTLGTVPYFDAIGWGQWFRYFTGL